MLATRRQRRCAALPHLTNRPSCDLAKQELYISAQQHSVPAAHLDEDVPDARAAARRVAVGPHEAHRLAVQRRVVQRFQRPLRCNKGNCKRHLRLLCGCTSNFSGQTAVSVRPPQSRGTRPRLHSQATAITRVVQDTVQPSRRRARTGGGVQGAVVIDVRVAQRAARHGVAAYADGRDRSDLQ